MTSRRSTLSLLAALAVIVGACSVGGSPAPRSAAPSVALPSVAASLPAASAPAGSAPTSGGIPEACPDAEPPALPAGQSRLVRIETALGSIQITVEADLGPRAAGNFVALVECGYYDGVVFHRIVPTFVIQGGDGQFGRAPNLDPNTVGSGGPGYAITDDAVSIPYERGTVAMARTPAPNSQGSQFFIVLDNGADGSLTGVAYPYAIFGRVTAGMEVVDAIAAAAAGVEKPAQPVVMESVSIERP